jgi:hypothetical protein
VRHSCYSGLSPAVTPGAAVRPRAASWQRPHAAHCCLGLMILLSFGLLTRTEHTASSAGSRRTHCHPCSHTTLLCNARVGNLCDVLFPYNAPQNREQGSQAASRAPSVGVHSWAALAAGVLACPPCSQIKPYLSFHATKVDDVQPCYCAQHCQKLRSQVVSMTTVWSCLPDSLRALSDSERRRPTGF